MKFLTKFLTIDLAVAGVVGGVLGKFGEALTQGNQLTLYLLFLVCILIDWISGVAAAIKDGTHSSEYGRNGVYRTFVIVALPAIGYFLDVLLKNDIFPIFYVLTGQLAYYTFVSLTANVARAGWEKHIPVKVLNFISSELESKVLRSQERIQQKEEKKKQFDGESDSK